jgi:hypothetical protein
MCPTVGHFCRIAARVRTGNLLEQNRENRFEIRECLGALFPGKVGVVLRLGDNN